MQHDEFHPRALTRLGIILFNNKNYEKGLFYIEIAANLDEPEAQLFLGLVHLLQNSKKFDINKGVCYLTLFAKKGYIKVHFCQVDFKRSYSLCRCKINILNTLIRRITIKF